MVKGIPEENLHDIVSTKLHDFFEVVEPETFKVSLMSDPQGSGKSLAPTIQTETITSEQVRMVKRLQLIWPEGEEKLANESYIPQENDGPKEPESTDMTQRAPASITTLHPLYKDTDGVPEELEPTETTQETQVPTTMQHPLYIAITFESNPTRMLTTSKV